MAAIVANIAIEVIVAIVAIVATKHMD